MNYPHQKLVCSRVGASVYLVKLEKHSILNVEFAQVRTMESRNDEKHLELANRKGQRQTSRIFEDPVEIGTSAVFT